MAFFEAEFPRAIEFDQEGGQEFNTDVQIVQSGQEQRNKNWLTTRGEYTASVIATGAPGVTSAAFIEQVRRFFLMISGRGDAFRYFDPLDFGAGAVIGASSEPMAVIAGTSNLQWQLQKTYSLGSRTYVRTITKPIGPGAIDYLGNPLTETVVIHPSGGTFSSLDHTTGIATFSAAPTGTPSADFEYHIPVRLTADKFAPRAEKSNSGNRITRWNMGLMIVNPPNY